MSLHSEAKHWLSKGNPSLFPFSFFLPFSFPRTIERMASSLSLLISIEQRQRMTKSAKGVGEKWVRLFWFNYASPFFFFFSGMAGRHNNVINAAFPFFFFSRGGGKQTNDAWTIRADGLKKKGYRPARSIRRAKRDMVALCRKV